MEEFDARYRRIHEGDLAGAERFVAELNAQSEFALAKRVALLMSLGSEATFELPEASDGPDVETLALQARRAFITLQHDDLDAAIQQLSLMEGAADQHTLWTGFRDTLFDRPAASETGTVLYQAARRSNDPILAVDAITLEAASAMVDARYDDALLKARQAARMAQTEHLWLPHYFASLFLSRLRRLTGTCHAAVRIADAALAAMPSMWHGWFQWERLCASAPASPTTSAIGSPLAMGASMMVHWLDASTSWTQPAFPPQLLASTIHRRDIEAAAALFGNPVKEPAIDIWLHGRAHSMPPHMLGFASRGESSGALVVAAPKVKARRIAEAALPPSVPAIGPSPKQATRVGMLLSALALAGEDGLARDVLFEQTYGFRYNAEAHDAAFRVLRHHASRHAEGHAQLSQEGKQHFMTVHTPFAVEDPRTVRPFKDMMLQMLARQGGQSARSVASDLGVPLRTVQAALKEMVGDGMCSSERSGNKVTYEVEDTTFAPLTMG